MVQPRVKKILFWASCAAAVAVLAFIWTNSLFPAEVSGEMSGNVTKPINDTLHAAGVQATVTEHTVRKSAHFTEFAALGALTACACRTARRRVRYVWAVALCAVCAAVDESIQLFSDGRAAQVTDALLDTCGALCGVCALALAVWCVHRAHRRRGG